MKNMKRMIALLLACVMMCSIVACGAGETSSHTEASTQTEVEKVVKPTKDRSGEDISVPENVERIVTLAPSITETLMNLGCTDKIVAVDTNTKSYEYEGLSQDLPAFDMMAPDNEQLAALNPDVVFISGMTATSGKDLYADLKDMGICVISIPSSYSIQGIKDDITFIASCVDEVEEGKQIVDTMTKQVDEIAEIGKTITDKKKVYFEIAAAPNAYSFGTNTFLNEMIELIGAENILADQEGWLSVETESVVSKNPDVILTSVNYLDDAVGEILSRKGWEAVNAIKDKQVYYIDNRASSLPNENIIKALKEMAVAIYPDVYEK